MWQVSNKYKKVQVHILDALWPEFGFTHLLPIVLKYQREHHKTRGKINEDLLLERDLKELKEWRRVSKLANLKRIIEDQ